MTVPAPVTPDDEGGTPLANPKHEAFAREYVACNNVTAAYAAAFTGTAKTAKTNGHRLRYTPLVAARIDWLRRESIATLNAKASSRLQDVIERLWWLADYPDVSALYQMDDAGWITLKPMEQWPPALRYAIKRITTKTIKAVFNKDGEQVRPPVQILSVELEGRKAPLELLGRHYGAFPTEQDGPKGAILQLFLNGTPWRTEDPALAGKTPIAVEVQR